MSFGRLPLNLTGAYRLKRNHPLARNLVALFLPGGMKRNIVDGLPLTVQGTHTNPAADTLYGASLHMDGLGSGQQGLKVTPASAYIAGSGGTKWSIYSLARITGGGSGGGSLYGERPASGNDIIKLDVFNVSLTFTQEIVIRNDAGTILQVQDNTLSSQWHVMGATKNGNGGGGNVIMYRDGVNVKTGNWTGTESFTNANIICSIGSDPLDGHQNSGWINITGVWTRVLSASEMLQLYLDPYCLIEPISATVVNPFMSSSAVLRIGRSYGTIFG